MENSKPYQFTGDEVLENRLQNIFNHIPVAIALIDRDFSIIYLNEKSHEIIQFLYEKTIKYGENISKLVSEKNKEAFKNYLENVFHGNDLHIVRELGKLKYRKLWLDITFQPLKDESGNINEVIISANDITNIKIAEEIVKESDIKYKAIVDTQTEVICRFKADGTIIFVNNAYCRFFNTSPEKIINADFFQLIPEEYRINAKNDIKKLSVQEPSNNYIQEIKNKHGETRWISGTNTAIFDHTGKLIEVQTVGKDITEIKELEFELQQTNRKFQAILRTSPDPIFIFNRDGYLINCYTSDLSKLFLPKEEIMGKNFREFSPPDLINLFSKSLKSCFSGEEDITIEYKINIADELRYYETKLARFSDNEALAFTRDITERKKSEYAIVRSEELYRKIIGTAPFAVVIIDPKGCIIFHSKQLNLILNCEEEKDLSGSMLNEWLHEEDLEKYHMYIRNISDDYFSSEKQLRFVKEDGDIINVEINVTSISSKIEEKWGVMVVMRDVTEKIDAEKERKLLISAMEQSPVSIVITNLKGEIEYVNHAFSAISGYSAKEVIGKNPNILKSGYTREKTYQEMWKTITSGKVWIGELFNKKKDGTLYWENATIAPVKSDDGKITHYLGVKEDITEQKRVLTELEKAKIKAEEADKVKSAFLANISHEVRTPLNGILGFVELMGTLVPDQGKSKFYLDMITKSSKQLLTVMNDILEIAVLESKNFDLSPSDVSVKDIITNLVEYYKGYLSDHKRHLINLKQSVPETGQEFIHIDGARLTQILMNLIDNAIKFTRKGTVEFGYKFPIPYMIQFFVKDTGIGIEDDKMEVIFKPFRQGHESIAREFGGSGLGLTISKILIKRMGGNIWIESKPGSGTSFYVEFPITKIKKSKRVVSGIENEEDFYKWPNKKILIIEDHYINYMLLKELLRKTKVSLLLAQNGTEGLKLVAENRDIDLILLDIMLPDINGFEVAKKIHENHKNIPIVAVTAYSNKINKKTMNEYGFSGFLAKPFSKKLLLETVNQFFTKKS